MGKIRDKGAKFISSIGGFIFGNEKNYQPQATHKSRIEAPQEDE
jgi:hypothetical protein